MMAPGVIGQPARQTRVEANPRAGPGASADSRTISRRFASGPAALGRRSPALATKPPTKSSAPDGPPLPASEARLPSITRLSPSTPAASTPRSVSSAATPGIPTLSSLSSAMRAVPWSGSGNARRVQHRRQQRAVIEADVEVVEPQLGQHVRGGRADLGLDQRRRRADGVHVALEELAEAPARRPVGPPDRLHLIALEELGQLGLVVGDHAGQRHGEVVAQGQIGLPAGLALAALQDLEDELVALFAVLSQQRLEVLDRRRLDRLEPVALVDARHHGDHVLPAADVVGQEVAHPARGLGSAGAHSGSATSSSGKSRR